MIDALYLFGAFVSGCITTLGVCWVVAGAYARISGRPGPSGVTYSSAPLPFSIKDDHAEADIEKQYLVGPIHRDAIDGIGR